MKHFFLLAPLCVLGIFFPAAAQYDLTVESSPAVGTGGTVYRFYVNMEDPTDRMSAVYGNDQASLLVSTPDGAFNSAFNSSWSASGINPAFLPVFPDMADDTYATIGLEGPAATSGIAGAADPSIVEDNNQPVTPYFLTPGATDLVSTTLTGASWYILNTAANGLPDADMRVLIMQVTTAGAITGQMNYQIFPLGVGADQLQLSATFDGAGTFPAVGGPGCTDPTACNYDPEATTDDGSCGEDGCGVCNGPGAIYECGCSDIPAGDCDCWGNQLDVLGVCGGDCTADADADGICDDVDDCVGTYDECGICNGPGAINECGCSDLPAGDCDCNGNQLDAVGVCGGDCTSDTNSNGICDADEISGCTVSNACNYDGTATLDDGSCDYCSCAEDASAGVDFPLIVEASPAVGTGGTVYRFYVQMQDPTDRMSSVFGNDQASLLINTPAGAFNSTFNSSWNASGINPAFLPVFPDMADDTYATIGLTGPAATSGIAGAADPSIVEDSNQPVTPYFLTPGATNLESTTLTGASWYILNTAANGLPDADMRVLIAQVTTAGAISGQMNYQVFPLGVGADQQQIQMPFDGAGIFGAATNACGCTDTSATNYDYTAEYDDGSCVDVVFGCTDATACNFNSDANTDNGSCEYCSCNDNAAPYPLVVEASEAVDTSLTVYRFYIQMQDPMDRVSAVYGNNSDSMHVYAPDGVFNSPYNGSWNASGLNAALVNLFPDLADDTFGTIGLNGPANGSLGQADPMLVEDNNQMITPFFQVDGTTMMESNTLTGAAWYILNTATNGLPDEDLRVLIMQVTTSGEIHGRLSYQVFPLSEVGPYSDVQISVDFNGVGVFDGTNNQVVCGCTDWFAANFNEEALFDDGSCLYEGCTNPEACNYDSLSNLDDGSCVFPDALNVCGGTCEFDDDGDGICDDVDDCVGAYDACGVCNGPGAIYECGCADIPVGDCDCGGNQIDALGVCGGACTADADADGICDDVDDCVGTLDACGVCNGPGSIYECGCFDIAEGACDCYGNDLDALGECGGLCESDFNDNGVCDDLEMFGCTYADAYNFDPDATTDDHSCVFPCPGDINGDGDIQLGDLLDLLTAYGTSCSLGCTNPNACNFDSTASSDDGTCIVPPPYLNCDNSCQNDLDEDGICDELDDCVGDYDECGVCNGPGAVYPIIESIQTALDSVFIEALDEWYVFEVGVDTTFSYVCESQIIGCGGTVTHLGHTYSTVAIGNQCWYAENVRYLPEVSPGFHGSEHDNSPHAYVYGYSDDNVSEASETFAYHQFGALYNFLALDLWDLCPSGWRVPSDSDWVALESQVGVPDSLLYTEGARGGVSGVLKDAQNWNGSNETGFSALPGGARSSIYSTNLSLGFADGGFSAYFWSSTLLPNEENVWRRAFGTDSTINRLTRPVHQGYSLRCTRELNETLAE